MNANTRDDYPTLAERPQAREASSRNQSRKRQRQHSTSSQPQHKRARVHRQEKGQRLKKLEAEAGPHPKVESGQAGQAKAEKNRSSIYSLANSFPASTYPVESNASSPLQEYVEHWLQNTSTPKRKQHAQDYSPGTTVSSTASSSSSPEKRRHSTEGMDNDVDATPKPRRKISKLQRRDLQPDGASDSSRSQSTQSKRSASPVKRIIDMRFFSNPVVMKIFDDPAVEIRADLWETHRQISRFSRGVGVISARSQADIKSREERSFRNIDDDAFGQTTLPTPSAAAVAHLVGHAQTCDRKGHSEASWNCMVHSPLLDMALCGCGYPVEFLNW